MVAPGDHFDVPPRYPAEAYECRTGVDCMCARPDRSGPAYGAEGRPVARSKAVHPDFKRAWRRGARVVGGIPPQAKGETIVTRQSCGCCLSGDLEAIAPRPSEYAMEHPDQPACRHDMRGGVSFCRGRSAYVVVPYGARRNSTRFARRQMPGANSAPSLPLSLERDDCCLFEQHDGNKLF